MVNEIKFLLQQKKASNHLFSKQLKTSNRLGSIGGFISIIYSNQTVKYYRLHYIHTFIGSAKPPD